MSPHAVRAAADNHVALRVSDIECSARFYIEALDGQLQTKPVERSGQHMDDVFGPGTRVKLCHIGFERGAVELWQFLEPVFAIPPADQHRVGQMHFSFTVNDVAAYVQRIVTAGGKQRFAIKKLSAQGPEFVCCEDLDGHVFEMIGGDHEEVVRRIIEREPEAAP